MSMGNAVKSICGQTADVSINMLIRAVYFRINAPGLCYRTPKEDGRSVMLTACVAVPQVQKTPCRCPSGTRTYKQGN